MPCFSEAFFLGLLDKTHRCDGKRKVSPRVLELTKQVFVKNFEQPQSGGRRVDLATALETPTPAEMQTFPLLIKGLRTKEIADRLSVSFHTLKHHCRNILEKCEFGDRLALIAKAHPLPGPVTPQSVHEAPKPKNPQVPPLPKVDLPSPPTAAPKGVRTGLMRRQKFEFWA